jgi:hypothetical protein
MIDLKDTLNKAVKLKSKAWPVYNEIDCVDRRNFVTSSEVGKCFRAMWYNKYPDGYSDEERKKKGKLVKGDGFRTGSFNKWGFAERGNSVEAWVVEHLVEAGVAKFMFVGDAQVTFVAGVQAGTPDGIIMDTVPYLLEIKSFDPRSNKSAFPKPEHIRQVQQNMDLLRRVEPDRFVVPEAALFYVNASDFEDTLQFNIKYDPYEAEKLRRRAEKIMNTTEVSEAPPEGIYTGECKTCEYAGKCSGAVQMSKNEQSAHKKAGAVASNVFGKK